MSEAERWSESHPEDLTEDEAAFLGSCLQKRHGRRTRWVLVGVLTVMTLVGGYLGYTSYSAWKDNQPWGYLLHLSTGRMHSLKGDLAMIGRSTDEFHNQVHLKSRYVSRLHLFVLRDLKAIDVRTVNGTTVNAEFVPYGHSHYLKTGDIIVFAGVEAVRFSTTEFSPLSLPSPSIGTWGILVDGRAKVYHHLDSHRYFLSLGEGNQILLESIQSEKAFFVAEAVHVGGERALKVRFMGAGKNDPLYVQIKEDDYKFPIYEVESGEEFTVAGSTTFKYMDAVFQIVLIEP